MKTLRTVRWSAAAMVLATGLAGGMSSSGMGSLALGIAAAQARGPVQRTVHGKVEDKSGAPVKGAVVYLQDTRSSAVKSAISEDDGSYRFVQLSQNTDYTLWAKAQDGRKSKNKSISSFDSKNEYEIGLTID